MNWKRGITRLFWVLSSSIGIIVLIFGSSIFGVTGIIKARDPCDAMLSFCAALLAFGLASGLFWLLYGLSIFVVRGFQDNDRGLQNDKTKAKNKIPKSPFWQWVTGRFTPENDPYNKKKTKRKDR